ncbi:MAG: hypothetical protein WC916_01005 [Candidatus Woesearchaeota archaeon]
MVRTSDGVLDINPLERMEKLGDISSEKKTSIAAKKKELEEFEKRKRQEMDELETRKRKEIEELDKRKNQGIKDVENKKKELADLEKQKTKEIEDTEELIETSFQDLMRHKRLLIKEEEDESEKKKEKHTNEFKLEYVANTAPKNKGPQPLGADYGKFFEEMHAPRNVYEATNYNFYSGLSQLRDRAARGEITPEEEAFVSKIREQFEGFRGNEYVREKDEHMYIERSMNVINQIWQYKTGQRSGGSRDIQY